MCLISRISVIRNLRTLHWSVATKSETKVPNIARLQKISQKRNQIKLEKKDPSIIEHEMKRSNRIRQGFMLALISMLTSAFLGISCFYTVELWAQTEEEMIRLEKIAEKENVS